MGFKSKLSTFRQSDHTKQQNCSEGARNLADQSKTFTSVTSNRESITSLKTQKMFLKKTNKTHQYEISSLVLAFAKDDSTQQQGTLSHILMVNSTATCSRPRRADTPALNEELSTCFPHIRSFFILSYAI